MSAAEAAAELVRASWNLRVLRHAEEISGRTLVTGQDIDRVKVAVRRFTNMPGGHVRRRNGEPA